MTWLEKGNFNRSKSTGLGTENLTPQQRLSLLCKAEALDGFMKNHQRCDYNAFEEEFILEEINNGVINHKAPKE